MQLPFLRQVGMAAGALGALGAGAFGYALRRPLPQVDGERTGLRGLESPVEVVRDRWGIPHISALTPHDAFFAQGYCHAQDRLWQMEISRRVARGQLAEVLGPAALDTDRLMRRLGLHRAAQAEWDAAEAATRQVLEAYASGVNAWLDTLLASGKLPVEFTLTRITPRPWEPLDSLAFGRFFALTLSPNLDSELIRSRLIARLGAAAVAAIEPDVWQVGSDALPRLSDWGPAEMPAVGDLPPVSLPGGQVGSNGWVVSGARSTTGKPLLANDPHLFPRMPAIFYECHLVGGGDLNVAGASAAGAPGVLIGHNRDIAWGITAGMVDVQDLYVERLHPGDPTRVEYAGRWERGTVVHEVIPVKGRARPWIEDVLLTPRHGPLLTPTPAFPDEHRPLALRSSVLEAPEQAAGLIALNRAHDWESFRAALARLGTPPLNVLYADAAGNIGYQLNGLVPRRARGEGLVPSPGWSGQYEWTGWIPFDDLPRAFNPPNGLWASANNEVVTAGNDHLGHDFVDPARYQRIRQVLDAKQRHSAVDFSALQADEVSLPAREIAKLLAQHLTPRNPLEAEALGHLRAWDGRMSADSTAAAIYQVFREGLLRAMYGPQLGDLMPVLVGVGPHPVIAPVSTYYFLATRRVQRLVERWAGVSADGPTPGTSAGGATADPSVPVERAFTATVRLLRARLGPRVHRWQWGRLHPLRLEHALSVQKPLGLLFDVPTFPWGGDLETLRAGGYKPGTLEAGGPTSGYRFIADTSDWDESLSCIPGGQSGHRGSPHYDDQVAAWRRVAYHPLAYTRPAIARYAVHTLRLRPA